VTFYRIGPVGLFLSAFKLRYLSALTRDRYLLVSVELIKGAYAIQKSLILQLKAIGIHVTHDDIEWNDGHGLLPPLTSLRLRIAPSGRPSLMQIFSRHDIERSASNITQLHVQQKIEQVVAEYCRLKGWARS
jgi:hypothetical protein